MQGPAFESHETIRVLNPNSQGAATELTLYFADGEPAALGRASHPAVHAAGLAPCRTALPSAIAFPAA
jgi:hypothetical protein